MAIQTAAADGLFDPASEQTKVQDYSANSKGYQAANNSALIAGAGDVIKDTATLVDDTYKTRIRKDAQDNFEDIQGQRIADLQSTITQGSPPAGMQRGLDRMAVAAQSNAAGRISDTQYYTALDTTARMLKNKYPGYTDYVDKAIKSTTGVDPANALMQSLKHEADKAIKPQKDEFDTRAWQATQSGTLPADFEKPGRSQYYRDNPDQFMAKVNANNKRNAGIAQAGGAIGQAAPGADTVTAAYEYSKLVLDKNYSDAILPMETQFGPDFSGIIEAVKTGMINGKPATPEERVQLSAQLDMLQENIETKAKAQMVGEKTKSGKTLKELGVDPEAAIQPLRNRFAEYRKAIETHNYGVAAVDTTQRAADDTGKYPQKWQSQFPVTDTMKRFSSLPPEIAGKLVTDSAKLGPAAAATANTGVARVIGGEAFTKVLASIKNDSPMNPDAIAKTSQQVLKLSRDVLLDPKVDPLQRIEAAKSFYGQENKAMIKEIRKTDPLGKKVSDQLLTYQYMTDARTTKAMWDLGGQDDNNLTWDAYKKWASNEYMGLFRQHTADVANLPVDQANVRIGYDPDTQRFSVTSLPRKAGGSAVSLSTQSNIAKEVQDAVSEYNKQLSTLTAVWKQAGHDPNEVVKTVFTNVKGPLIQTMVEAMQFQSTLTPAEKAAIKKAKEPTGE